ncbi:fas apoptotic inhibitory molecule 2b [Pimephales promelas]|uniref:fas apoptotic inhibitory molecule 2b n=1 Tax=Pimephales promelas TaxID=90988 RepID=UPI0019557C43|nr:fas apoptotic inhibitory molecule 2b [Pimephales promelas]KAG1931033.1 protein lifeguard [Pimephales promelas]
MTLKKISPTVQTVEGQVPPSYEEANAGCPGYYYGEGTFSWDDKYIRRIFIRKVYSILMLQLFLTVAVIALFTFHAPVRMYIQTHPILYSMSNLLFLITYFSLVCCGDLRRKFPWNFILLTIFTLSMASMLGFISSFYNTKSVMLCIGITATVLLCVTIFSFQSKIDITSYQGVLFSLCMVMFFCAIVMGFVVPFGYVPWLHAVYASIGAVVFTMFLAFDLQMLMGNKQYAMSPEEYIFATLSLYLDVVYLFTFLLQLFGDGRE